MILGRGRKWAKFVLNGKCPRNNRVVCLASYIEPWDIDASLFLNIFLINKLEGTQYIICTFWRNQCSSLRFLNSWRSTSNSPNFEAISRCKQSGHWQRAVSGLFFSLVPPQFQNKDSQIKWEMRTWPKNSILWSRIVQSDNMGIAIATQNEMVSLAF